MDRNRDDREAHRSDGMPYFSRLTDIVTCNLSEILSRETDAAAALERILVEMHAGLAGARRSVQTAQSNESRLRQEIDERRRQAENWLADARRALTTGNENEARMALIRKGEVEDLVGGIEQQLEAAVAAHEHLATTLRALEARIAEAERKRETLGHVAATEVPPPNTATKTAASHRAADPDRARRIEAELDRLRREIAHAD